MITMDFTMTATNRIDIIEKTLQSFTKNLLGVDFKGCRLLINVDPVPTPNTRPEMTKQASDILEMCGKYFGDVLGRVPLKPNYTQAYKWLYTKAETKLIFNLEDDWAMNRQIDISVLTNAFNKYPELYAASFRAYPWRYISIPTSPQVLHKRFYKAVGEGLDPSINPEIQLRADKIKGITLPNKRPEHGRSIPMEGKCYMWPEAGGVNNVVVYDIGRDWINNQAFKKPDSKEQFTTWEKT